MVNIHIVRDKEGFIWEYTVKGHAGAGKAGEDIICAAVSAVAYTGVNALEELAGVKMSKKVLTVRDGYLKCIIPADIPDNIKSKVRTILETIAVGFKQIEYTPGYSEYISILDEEV